MITIVFPVEFSTNRGGVAQSILSLIKGLSKISHFKLIVVCPRESEMSKFVFPESVTVITSKASDWRISRKHIVSSGFIACDLYHKLKKHINNRTLFVTNHSGASYMVSLMPTWHVNELYVNRGGDFKSKGFGDFLMRNKIRLKLIDYSVAISNSQKEILINAGMPPSRISVIHNGLPLPSRTYEFRPLNSRLLRISTMGYYSSIKGQHIGVQLIKLLRDKGINAVLNLYGVPDTDRDYNLMLDRMVDDLGLRDYVFYRGFVTGEELFSQTDILISFSRREGFGRSLVEGMLRKIPVIAYRGAGGPLDITNDGEYCHLVDVNEASNYCSVILDLLSHPQENEKNVIQSYQYAMKMFTEDVMIHNYAALFNSIFGV